MEKQKRPTEADIKEWKAKHKEVHQIEVQQAKTDVSYIAVVRRPKMKDIEHALSMRAKKGDIQMAKTLYENCVLYEDAEIRQSDDLFLAAVTQMGELIEIAEASIKKL